MNEDRSYPTTPFVGVGAVVWKGDKILLIRRGKEPSYGEWSLPAGTQELGEEVLETLTREVLEETGCTIGEPEFLGIFDEIWRDDEDRVKFHYTIIDYDADWASGDPRPGAEELDARFFSLSELASLRIWDKTLKAIHLSATRRGLSF